MSVDDVLFEASGVFLHTVPNEVPTGDSEADVLIGGSLKLVQKIDGRYVIWTPDEKEVCVNPKKTKPSEGWAVVDAVSYHNNGENGVSEISISAPQIESNSDQVDCDTQTNGTTPIEKRHRCYMVNFSLEDLKSIKQSSRSFGWPYMIFILKDGTTMPALHFHNGGNRSLLRKMKQYLSIKQSANDSRLFLVHEHDPNALHKSFDELHIFDRTAPALVSKFIQDPYSTTLTGFSKVTNFVRGSLMPEIPMPMQEDLLTPQELPPGLDTNDEEEPGYELITCADIPPRRNVKRGAPFSVTDWTKHRDADGHISDVPLLKETIFKGGIVDPAVRIEVWKFLLNYYPWDSTYKQQMEIRKKRVDDYFRMKLQWKSITPEQAQRFSTHRDREALIEKDVNRTDRTHEFFQGDNNPQLVLLHDILMTYCMYNFDLGYVQGMSDLLSPILFVMENEVDTFWCFCGFMELVHKNFEMNQEGMKKQLAQLHTLVQFLDVELCNHLESHDSSNMYFCFRWLLIMFKREFVFSDVMKLWEVLWTGKPCKNFHLLICVAILDGEKPVLLDNNFGFNEILKHINDICFQIDLEEVLRKAEAIYKQLCECKKLPKPICEIIGIPYQPTSVVDREPSPSASNNDVRPTVGGKQQKQRKPARPPPPGKATPVRTRPEQNEDYDVVDASTNNPI